MLSPLLVRLSGSPRERGRVHGETLKSVIRGAVERWQARVENLLAAPFRDYLSRFPDETRFKEAVRRWTPSLLDEIDGIAEGCGLERDLVFAWQWIDEHVWLIDRLQREKERAESSGCSALGRVWPEENRALIGQNWDIPAIKEGVQTLLHITYPDSDLETLVVTQAGAVGALGLNNGGTGLLINTLPHLNPSTEGLPVSCLVRGALEQGSFRESDAFVRNVRHATGQNYLLSSGREMADLECSGNSVMEFRLAKRGDRACHSNHPLVHTDSRQDLLKKLGKDFHSESTRKRFEYLEKRTLDPDQPWTVEGMKSTLKNPLVCVEPDNSRGIFTAACVIMELGERPCLHMAPGPPSMTPFTVYAF